MAPKKKAATKATAPRKAATKKAAAKPDADVATAGNDAAPSSGGSGIAIERW